MREQTIEHAGDETELLSGKRGREFGVAAQKAQDLGLE
jgi:hypothetical protein